MVVLAGVLLECAVPAKSTPLSADWFEHFLIDHDVASNWGNWCVQREAPPPDPHPSSSLVALQIGRKVVSSAHWCGSRPSADGLHASQSLRAVLDTTEKACCRVAAAGLTGGRINKFNIAKQTHGAKSHALRRLRRVVALPWTCAALAFLCVMHHPRALCRLRC